MTRPVFETTECFSECLEDVGCSKHARDPRVIKVAKEKGYIKKSSLESFEEDYREFVGNPYFDKRTDRSMVYLAHEAIQELKRLIEKTTGQT